jgi:hypothetical protein
VRPSSWLSAYYRIDDPALRRRLFDLARALAGGAERVSGRTQPAPDLAYRLGHVKRMNRRGGDPFRRLSVPDAAQNHHSGGSGAPADENGSYLPLAGGQNGGFPWFSARSRVLAASVQSGRMVTVDPVISGNYRELLRAPLTR